MNTNTPTPPANLSRRSLLLSSAKLTASAIVLAKTGSPGSKALADEALTAKGGTEDYWTTF